MMKVFAYRKCSTCMKALKWMEAHNVEFEERAIKEENPTYEELKEWYTMSGLPLKKFFNTSGMIYKQMNLKDKLKEMILPLFNEHFGTAFMGRANLIPFIPLHTNTLRDIAIIKIDKICQRFEQASGQMYKIDYNDTLIDWIIDNCQYAKFGARDIDAVLNTSVLPVLARHLIDSEVKKTTKKIRMSVRRNNISLRNL